MLHICSVFSIRFLSIVEHFNRVAVLHYRSAERSSSFLLNEGWMVKKLRLLLGNFAEQATKYVPVLPYYLLSNGTPYCDSTQNREGDSVNWLEGYNAKMYRPLAGCDFT